MYEQYKSLAEIVDEAKSRVKWAYRTLLLLRRLRHVCDGAINAGVGEDVKGFIDLSKPFAETNTPATFHVAVIYN